VIKVSGRRIKEFLLLPETTSPLEGGGEDVGENEKLAPSASCTLVDIQASTDSVFVLENIAEDEEEDQLDSSHHHHQLKPNGGQVLSLLFK